MKKGLLFFLGTVLMLSGCRQRQDHLFRLVPADESGVDFNNTVEEKDTINILNVQYMYHGGAVAIGDFNNDKQKDIFFSGNMVGNGLYLNRGNLKFENISEKAGIVAADKWNAGVAVADVNADGWLDIYVCATIIPDSSRRANMLFINKGPDENGMPLFKDEAQQYGIDDKGYSQNAAFLDYDKDGDLDLYVLTNLESDKIPSVYRPRILDGSALNNDRLYRNNGNNTFTDVTIQAGILVEGYGLGIGIADINNDGWPDIYIGNDYVSNDILYINNRDGTFSNEISDRLKHQSLFSMGVDIADVNNDLHPDIITLDMLPENNLRRKTISGGGATYVNYINNLEYGYEFQYMRNMLHRNNGDGTFSEIGQMAGVHQTEWSWSSLFADVDNDGLRDLLVTNGFPKDVTDRDYVMFKREAGAFNHQRSLIDSIPVLKIPSYGFKNNGNFSFSNMTVAWGLDQPSFSNGAAFADLDNDGDLDYVVNNINDNAFLYENTLYTNNLEKKSDNNYLRIELEGTPGNKSGLGTKITVFYDSGKMQYHDHSIYRGYLSTMENVAHFGVGNNMIIDSLLIDWPDGARQTLKHVNTNQVLTIARQNAIKNYAKPRTPLKKEMLVQEISNQLNIHYKHREWDKIDFYKQRTLPHKFSQCGPGLAVGDINADGMEDFIVGGSARYNATLFLQQTDGKFSRSDFVKGKDHLCEDEGLLLFDADQDSDLDLYVVSGSYEYEAGDNRYQDRLYRNDGKGNFTPAIDALPETTGSGSCVRAADFDADGDLDVFVGGRVITGSYPLPPESYLLRNDGGKFTNATSTLSPSLQNAGMVTDALWTDFNNDHKIDLVVVGEFMAVTFFKNTGQVFEKIEATGIENYTGWWNSISAADFDRDGDTDYIVGNLGNNNYYNMSKEHPLRAYAKDFDANESTDVIMSCYFKSETGEFQEYATHPWDELYAQSPKFRNQFSRFKQYGAADMKTLLKPYDQNGMLILSANYPLTSYIENKGNNTFAIKALPDESQVAPVNGLSITDINRDGYADVLMTGNDYGNEVFAGRYDAFTGLILLGLGDGTFRAASYLETGFKVKGDAKALASLNHVKLGRTFIATQNIDSLLVFTTAMARDETAFFEPLPDDSWAELEHMDGTKEKTEFYYGIGYLSQPTRTIEIPGSVTKIKVSNFQGKFRIMDRNQLAHRK